MGSVIQIASRIEQRLAVASPRREAGPSRSSARETARSLLERVVSLISAAEDVDTRRFESSVEVVIREVLVPALEDVLDQAMCTLTAVFEHYEDRERAGGEAPDEIKSDDFSCYVDELMRTASSRERIADVAMIARMELSRRRERLQRLSERAGAWEIIAVAASVRRRILKSATALQRAICLHEGVDCHNSWFRTELERSLEVRRVYALFRRRLELERPPSPEQVYSRLRLAGTSLAILIGSDIYESLRVSDRRMIRELQSKIIAWLRGASEGGRHPARAGAQIWHDVAAFANLLMQVNNRAELLEHDRAALTRVAGRLASGCSGVELPAELLGPLEGIAARDGQLEELVLAARAGTPPELSEFQSIVVRLRAALERGRVASPRW